MNRISTIKKEYLKEEFIKQIKDNYTLEIALILLEEFEQLQQENHHLKNNNKILNEQKENAYKIADDYYKENQQLKEQQEFLYHIRSDSTALPAVVRKSSDVENIKQLQQRIDIALEEIKDKIQILNALYKDYPTVCIQPVVSYLKHLLEILKGTNQ